MSASDVHHCSCSSRNPCIWFFRLCWLALWWKYLVFLSPAGSQIALDRCLQNSWSCKSKQLISSRTLWIWSWFSARFIEVSASNPVYFDSICSLELPKVRLHLTKAMRQAFIFSNNWYIGLPVRFTPSHTSRITPSQAGSGAHLSSNLFGFRLLLVTYVSSCVVIKIGSWSEYAAWRWCTLAKG